jgi:hypothetical protein
MTTTQEKSNASTVAEWIFADEDSSLRRYHIVGESLYATLRSTASLEADLMLRAMRALPPFATIPMSAMDFPSTRSDVIEANGRFASGEWSIDEAFVAIGGDIGTIASEVQP